MLVTKNDEQIIALKNRIAVLPEVVEAVSGICAVDLEFGKAILAIEKSGKYFQEKEFPLIHLMIIIDDLFEAFGSLDVDGITKYRNQLTELLAPFVQRLEQEVATPKR